MTLFYCLGGGLGHLTRARATAHTLRIEGPIRYLVSAARDWTWNQASPSEVIPTPTDLGTAPRDLAVWIQDILGHLRPKVLFIDAFPAGLRSELAELDFPPGCQIKHLARNLRWQAYRRAVSGAVPRFDQTYRMEELDPEHEECLRSCSDQLADLTLVDPPARLPTPVEDSFGKWRDERRPLWLVVHSGPAQETGELLAYAHQLADVIGSRPRWVVVAPHLTGEDAGTVERIDLYPAHPALAWGDRIITACGFNLMRQTDPYAVRHHFLPFDRRYDDQAARGARYRRKRAS